MRWEDALFQQSQQLRFLRSAPGRRYMRAFEEDFFRKRPWVTMLPGAFTYMIERTLEEADPVYVSADVTEIIDRARETFEPEKIIPTDPFVPAGFALFPRSIRITDRRGNDNFVRAIAWMPIRDAEDDPTSGGVWVAWFSHASDPDTGDAAAIPWRALSPLAELQVLHATTIPWNEDPDVEHEMRLADQPGYDLDPDDQREAFREMWGLPQVMWRIGSQLVPQAERAPRAAIRDARRHGIDKTNVAVLRLRRTRVRYDDHGERDVDWSHRWLVRGHWRNQWYASIGAHRQIWINPYVKGPEDKDLVITQRAVEFVR